MQFKTLLDPSTSALNAFAQDDGVTRRAGVALSEILLLLGLRFTHAAASAGTRAVTAMTATAVLRIRSVIGRSVLRIHVLGGIARVLFVIARSIVSLRLFIVRLRILTRLHIFSICITGVLAIFIAIVLATAQSRTELSRSRPERECAKRSCR